MRARAGLHEPQLVPAFSALPIAATSASCCSAIAATIVLRPTSKQELDELRRLLDKYEEKAR